MGPNGYQRGWYQQNGQWFWYPGYPGEQPDFSTFPVQQSQHTNAQPTPQWPWLNQQPQTQSQPQPQVQQQNQQQAPPSVIPGRPVKTIDDVKPNEVPMDGTICFFPLSDMSYIYAKQWGSDGKLETVPYQRVQTPTSDSSAQQEPQQVAPDFSNEFTTLNQKLDSMLKTMSALDVSLGLSDKKGE